MINNPLFANKRIRVNRGICQRIKRSLKGPGKILARVNTEIVPHDVLGNFKLTTGFSKVSLASKLGVSPQDASQYIKKNVGEIIYKGELIAFKKTLFGKSEVVSPTDGIFESFDKDSGEISLRMVAKDMSLTSGVFGVVEEVDHIKGEIIIRSMLTEIYGIVGTGSEREGFVNVISGASDLVNPDKIPDDCKGQILIAGSLLLEANIKKGLSNNASGIVCGGLNLDDYLSMAISIDKTKRVGTEIGISILATEGFGPIPIGPDIYELLKEHHSKFALIEANQGKLLLPSGDPDSILSCRKVSLPKTQVSGIQPELELKEIELGFRVRLIWPPFLGAQGEVVAIDNTPTKLESGIQTYLLTVSTPYKKIRVPYTNVEMIS